MVHLVLLFVTCLLMNILTTKGKNAMEHVLNCQTSQGCFGGQFLISMPGIGDTRFDHTVIYLCAHSNEGAMGIVINKRASGIVFRDLLHRLRIVNDQNDIHLPHNIDSIPVQMGGPVETSRGFVLHSTDYFSKHSTLSTNHHIGLTASLDILQAVAEGHGPRHMLMALGYVGWGPGQLEDEMKKNVWLNCSCDEDLLFTEKLESRYLSALKSLGVDIAHLSAQAGSA